MKRPLAEVKRVEGLSIKRARHSRARSIFDRISSRPRLVALAAFVALAGLLVLRRDRARAGFRKVSGKAKEVWGRRRGDVSLELEGQAEQATAELEGQAEQATAELEPRAAEVIEERPQEP